MSSRARSWPTSILGKIQKWNDPAIAGLNPGLKLPDPTITVVHRSDGSGTTFNFANYLSKVSAEWKSKVGEGTSVQWPAGVGGKGNEGVAAYVKQIQNSIGYVEIGLRAAEQDGVRRDAERGRQVRRAEPGSFQAAAASADWTGVEGLPPGHDRRPGRRRLADRRHSFVLMYKQPKDAQRTRRRRWNSSSGRWSTASPRPRRSTTSRCPRRWSSRSRPTGPGQHQVGRPLRTRGGLRQRRCHVIRPESA